jgi:hypothetical protein
MGCGWWWVAWLVVGVGGFVEVGLVAWWLAWAAEGE